MNRNASVIGGIIVILLGWMGDLHAESWCIAPIGWTEITEIDCRPPVQDPRCATPCQWPPCDGYDHTVRRAQKFIWKVCGEADSYLLQIENMHTHERLDHFLGDDAFFEVDGTCMTWGRVVDFLPRMWTPGEGNIPMIGHYQWHVSVWEADDWEELDTAFFVYVHNSNPFGAAVMEFRWRTKPDPAFCGEFLGPTDFWIHLPMEYPDNRPGRSPYQWGYLWIQATDDLLPSSPILGTDYFLEDIPIPDGPDTRNIKLWLRDRVPVPESEIAYHLMFVLEDPWTPMQYDVMEEFDIQDTGMPKSRDVWPVEIVQAGYLDEGSHTAPMESILNEYIWCDPYPRCMACPREDMGEWCCYCWDGIDPEKAFCRFDPGAGRFDPRDRATWKGLNVLEMIRDRYLFRDDVSWTVEDNLRALDRLMSRWPVAYQDVYYPAMEHTSQYNSNDLLRLCDPAEGLDVQDHWRFTDAAPMNYFRTGLGCSYASTHLGLSMARLMNFPARTVNLAHYHDDIELWLPYHPPSGNRYQLDEGEWVRFIAEGFVSPDWTTEPPDPAGAGIHSSLTGIMKTTGYISWDAEDSIPFNWYLSGTEPAYETCTATLIDRQWPEKAMHPTLPEDMLRLLIVLPSRYDFSSGEGMADFRNIGGDPELGRWIVTQYLIPFGSSRFAYVLSQDDAFQLIVVDDQLQKTNSIPVRLHQRMVIEETPRYRFVGRAEWIAPYLYFQVESFQGEWSTPTPIPTPTPTIGPLGIDLEMPSQHYRSGDTFWLDAELSNPGDPIPQVIVFIVLEVAGQYYFWPSWSRFDADSGSGLDGRIVLLEHGVTAVKIILPITWPEVDGVADGLVFIGAMADDHLMGILGGMDAIEWSYE